MILPYPHNFRSKNYPIYYEFSSFKKAFQKMSWINEFLRGDGVLVATISGAKIVKEEILWAKNSKEPDLQE